VRGKKEREKKAGISAEGNVIARTRLEAGLESHSRRTLIPFRGFIQRYSAARSCKIRFE